MAHPRIRRARSSKAHRPAPTGQPMYAYAIEGDPLKVLSDLTLPNGASVAIITPGPTANAKLKRLKAMLFYRRETSPAAEKPAAAVPSDAFQPDARARALLRGVKLAEEDLRESGGAYTLAEVQSLMHRVSRQAIDKRVREGSLLGVSGPSNRRSYPAAQFLSDGSVVPGLKEVRDALPTKNPWMVLNFLVSPEPRIKGRKPIELLREGDLQPVIEIAKRIGVQGA